MESEKYVEEDLQYTCEQIETRNANARAYATLTPDQRQTTHDRHRVIYAKLQT
jgi:hypothetical protein